VQLSKMNNQGETEMTKVFSGLRDQNILNNYRGVTKGSPQSDLITSLECLISGEKRSIRFTMFDETTTIKESNFDKYLSTRDIPQVCDFLRDHRVVIGNAFNNIKFNN
jgi:hypothetical protein